MLGSDGRLLVHRRSDAKDVWPGMWDIGVGGVVGARRDVRRRPRARELAEELGVDGAALEPIGAGRYDDDDGRA